ncbi:TetR/AcrR family transcriptional regulator [Tomitella fengzijianii]|uniref:TetR/AcrR family transcriptional regulator n=2 Tax=Tomitella fengzijianii TaxID=2597660 RepID=A0A516X7D6_9ACTN|nr:TetR/AcrR family transcriptional regulator [Tomitella fengzijianii]
MEWSDRHTLIFETAAELFAAKGIAGTSVRDIADGVGVLSGSLYHYFASKDAIADAIITRYLDDLQRRYAEVLQLPEEERLRALVHQSLLASEANPHASEIYQNNATYMKNLAGYPMIRDAAKVSRRVWMQIIEDGVASDRFRSDLPPETIYGLLRDAVWLSQRWFTPTPEVDRSVFADQLVSVFVDGIGSGMGKSPRGPRR